MKSLSKDVRSILDKYIHRYKFNNINKEFQHKYIRYWTDTFQFYCRNGLAGINLNYRFWGLKKIYMYVFNSNSVCCKLPDNYFHAKLYK